MTGFRHGYYGVSYSEALPGIWLRHSYSCGSRISGAVGDACVWPPDKWIPRRTLGLDYDPDVWDPPRVLTDIPTPVDLGRL